MLDVDNKFNRLQHALPSSQSGDIEPSVAKQRLLSWSPRLDEAELDGVLHDMSSSNDDTGQPGSLSAGVKVQELLMAASTMVPWMRLHAYCQLQSTLAFVKQMHESDTGHHSTGRLPEFA